mmetsp:Transcript_16666/g.31569  ORF Transcript_16666/g.31569 Transcript_16666/m.31569 type:complete len:193 (-) Transcript_16666:1396-1974(-)
MGKETTRMLFEHARPQSEKLAEFIKKKKLETGMYMHPVIKRSIQSQRRASFTFSDSGLTNESEDDRRYFEDLNDPTFALSADTSTKLSTARSGTICAQDYYPSFLMAAESRYEISTIRNTTTAVETKARPPRDLSAKSLRESMRNLFKDDTTKVHSPEQKSDVRLSSRLNSIPKNARIRHSRSNPRGQKYSY